MHILQVYKDYYPVLGGMENHLRIISEGLAARGHTITALVSNTYPKTMIERLNGVTVIKAGEWIRRASTPLSPRMLSLSWRVPADLIHLHHPFPPGDLVYWLRRTRLPLVITHHSDIVRQKRLLQLYRPLLQRTLRAADRLIATSPQYIQSSPWLRPHAAKCTVIPLSVDATHFASPDQAVVAALKARYGGPLLLFVGRFRHYKGLDYLLAALRAVPAAQLVLVGTGGEEPHLQRLAEQLGLAERVHWAGDVADAELPAYYAAADVFVLPAHLRAEAFGIVQLEALAAGRPIVSTELGTGTSYVNQHEQTGLVVPPADPAALAQAINRLLADAELRARYGAAGQRRAREHFAPARMIDQIEQVYTAVLQRRQQK